MLFPLPIKVPPHALLYQNQFASFDNDPPEDDNTVEFPLQITFGEELAEVAAVEFKFKITNVLAQFVVLQVPSALTK